MDPNTWMHQHWQTGKSYIHQFGVDTGCHVKNKEQWPIGMDDKRDSRKSVLSACHDDDDIITNIHMMIKNF